MGQCILDLSKGIGQLAKKMIEMKIDVLYLLVCSLVTLALILPIATAIVERIFSAMNIIKNWLQNRMRDQWMNNCLVIYIEKYIYEIFWNCCMISSHSIVLNIYTHTHIYIYICMYIFKTIECEEIMQQFQKIDRKSVV